MKLRYLHLKKNNILEKSFLDEHCIAFMLKGAGECKSHIGREYTLNERDMVFCPASTSFTCTLKEDSEMMFVNFSNVKDPASVTFLNSLHLISESCLLCCEPHILRIKPELDGFFGFIGLIHNSCWLQDPVLLERILGGIFYLYSTAYSPKENALFFSPLICSEYNFKNLVLKHHLHAKNVSELAHLCNYPYHSFNRTFLKQFQTTPYKWMMEERKKRILQQLEDPTIPLKSIAVTFHFSSSSHFAKFCKQNFDDSASEIRRKRIEKTLNVKK